MSSATDITPDGWKIDACADGWALRWRPPLSGVFPGFPSLYRLIPSYGTRRWVQALLIVPWYAGELATLAGYDVDEQAPRLSVAIFLVAAWAIWDLMLNHERRVIVTDKSVRLWGSAYDVACLATVRMVARWVDRSRHKVLITSNSRAAVALVGWPGVSESTARAISEALIQKACPSSSDEEVRTSLWPLKSSRRTGIVDLETFSFSQPIFGFLCFGFERGWQRALTGRRRGILLHRESGMPGAS